MDYFAPDLVAGKVALITGGGTGLGFAMADALAAHGAAVAVASRSPEHVEPAAEKLRRHGVEALPLLSDVRDPESVAEMVVSTVETLGGLDILINNAAGNFLVRAAELSPNGWAAVRGIVLDGAFHCCRAAYPAFLERGGGAILNVVATYAEGAAPLVVHSGAAKAGLLSLTRTLAVEWAEAGIRVNAISPGPVPTDGAGGKLWAAPGAAETIARAVPMQRFGTLKEVADLATFLVSDAASYMTGGVYPVDGGLTLGGGLFDSRFAQHLRSD